MEVYILDERRRRTDVVDRFGSLIWTERYTAYGDFELVMHSTQANRSRFQMGTQIALNESDRIMTVETIQNKFSNGESLLTLSGRSLEQILEDRVAIPNLQGINTTPKWSLTGTPATIARDMFSAICRFGVLTADRIPDLESVFTQQFYTVPEPTETITREFEAQPLYEALKSICEEFNLGFSLTRVGDTSYIRFQVYAGNDRSLSQSAFPPVVFSTELDNLSNITELSSIEPFKNVAYVQAKNATHVVYAPGADPTISGFNRRVLIVKAHDIEDAAGPLLTQKLTQRGYEELAKARKISAFDGEIPQRGSYKYGRDYFLGDLITMRNSDGVSNFMRVTEQIFVSDSEGDRSYPTLSVELTATPGSWAAEDPTDTWGAATTETWSNP